jgi:hypothetical protein
VWIEFCRGGWRVILFAFVLSGFLHMQDRHGFKVVMDEVNLLSTSQRLHDTREAAMVGRGYYLSGTNFVIMQGGTDKRPLFYPFLLSLVHDFSGYRPANTFILNALLTPLFLLLVYAVARRLSGPAAGVAAVLLLATLPLLIQAMTGGGFELLNLVMIALVLLIGMIYAQRPTPDSLVAFCLSGVLLAQVRYESVLLIAPVGIVVLWTWWRQRSIELPWAVILCPLLLVGYVWQHQLINVLPDIWQLKDRASAHGAFSFDYFYDNVGHALNYFLSFDHTQANSHLLFIAGVIGIGFFWLILYREYRTIFREDMGQAVFVIFGLSLFVVGAMPFFYFWGAFDDIVASRLSLVIQLLMVWLFVYAWPRLIKAPGRWWTVSIIAIIYIFAWTAPTAARRSYAFENAAAETVNWLRSFIDSRHLEKSLVLDSHTLMLWLAYDIPATTLDAVAKREDEFLFHYHRHTFENIYVVQRVEPINYESGGWRPTDYREGFAKAMTLVSVDQIVFNPIYGVRVSRVTAINEQEFKAWAERRRAAQKLRASKSASSGEQAVQQSDEREKGRYIQEWLRNLP